MDDPATATGCSARKFPTMSFPNTRVTEAHHPSVPRRFPFTTIESLKRDSRQGEWKIWTGNYFRRKTPLPFSSLFPCLILPVNTNYRFSAPTDRTSTTEAVNMGLTVGKQQVKPRAFKANGAKITGLRWSNNTKFPSKNPDPPITANIFFTRSADNQFVLPGSCPESSNDRGHGKIACPPFHSSPN